MVVVVNMRPGSAVVGTLRIGDDPRVRPLTFAADPQELRAAPSCGAVAGRRIAP